MRVDQIARINQVADALWRSNGGETDGASSGELAAAAMLCGRPDWSGYQLPDGRTAMPQLYRRLGDWWLPLLELADVWRPPEDRETS